MCPCLESVSDLKLFCCSKRLLWKTEWNESNKHTVYKPAHRHTNPDKQKTATVIVM